MPSAATYYVPDSAARLTEGRLWNVTLELIPYYVMAFISRKILITHIMKNKQLFKWDTSRCLVQISEIY